MRLVPAQRSEPDCSFKDGELRGPGREPTAAAITVEMRDRAYQRGFGSRVREVVEFAVVHVQHLVASACDFEPCRAQEKQP
jgi:hypothetical protein